MNDGAAGRVDGPRHDGSLEFCARRCHRPPAGSTASGHGSRRSIRFEAGAETHGYLAAALSILGDEILVCAPGSSARAVEADVLQVLNPGEAQALAVAETTSGVLVTDDGDARRIARARDVEITGSIGLLVRFVEANQLSTSTADEYLKRWIDEAGFRSPTRDFDVFLE